MEATLKPTARQGALCCQDQQICYAEVEIKNGFDFLRRYFGNCHLEFESTSLVLYVAVEFGTLALIQAPNSPKLKLSATHKGPPLSLQTPPPPLLRLK